MDLHAETHILPAHDMDPMHAAVRRELIETFAKCRADMVRVEAHDMVRAHRAGMPMSEIAAHAGVGVHAVHQAILSSWARMR